MWSYNRDVSIALGVTTIISGIACYYMYNNESGGGSAAASVASVADVKVVNNNVELKNLPNWNYDGSSTGQASGNDSEVIIKMENIATDFPARHLTMYDKYVEHFGEPKKASKTAASGNYGYTKAVQKDVEVALRKLEKKVHSLARMVENKHPEAGSYFSTRCQGSNCNASKALGGACLLNQKPKRMVAGPLGFKPNCARASHKAITDLILYSGEVAHSLHSKSRNHVPYLETHAKKKRCPLTKLLLENYPVEIL